MQSDCLSEDTRKIFRDVANAIREDRLDEGAARLQEVHATASTLPVGVLLKVLILVRRGQALEALQYLNATDPDGCPELKALCLHALGDPLWEGIAGSLLDSDNQYVRHAMQQLLLGTAHAEGADGHAKTT